MLPEKDQIEAILSSFNLFEWARKQLPPGETMENKRYSDFISVTAEEVERYIQAHGFPGRLVYEEGGTTPFFGDDQLCIVGAGTKWEVFYTERGNRFQVAQFDTREEARRDLIRRRMRSARLLINSRYYLAHPELHLPPPNEME